jgi:hypothetical protein
MVLVPEELVVLYHTSDEIEHWLITQFAGKRMYPGPSSSQEMGREFVIRENLLCDVLVERSSHDPPP